MVSQRKKSLLNSLYDGRNIDLTPSEYAILVTLSENVGRPYSRLQLLTATLGESYAGYERAIDTHVSNLRKKIEPNPQKPMERRKILIHPRISMERHQPR